MKFPYAMLRDYVETSLDAERIGDLLTMAGFELEGIEQVEGDHVLDIKVMANRGDGLSVLGLSREVLAKDPNARPTELYERALAGFPFEVEPAATSGQSPASSGRSPAASGPPPPSSAKSGAQTPLSAPRSAGTLACAADRVTVRVETSECPRYACRLFLNAPNRPSPDWLQKRLRQAGQRPLGLLVDLTNYVMLELGQPLHAFDFDKVGPTIVVRSAKKGEKVTTLNGVEHELREGQMMICDADKPVATPGIMGGLETEVTGETENVLLESANFENTAIRKLRKELGLSTEASYRFERSVDPEGVVRALNRYAELLAQMDGGKSLVPGIVDVYPGKPVRRKVRVRLQRAETLLGVDLTLAQARRYLERLGFETSDNEQDTLELAVPTWRPDIVREDDLVEELGRVHGYEKIPERLPEGTTTQGGVKGLPKTADTLLERALRCGFDQIVSYSFRGDHPLDGPGQKIGPKNPHTPEAPFLRNSLLPCLADAALRNGARDVHFFEIGRIFGKNPSGKDEWVHFGLLSTGALLPGHWKKSESGEADFFSLKGALEECLAFGDLSPVFEAPEAMDGRFHPTRWASVSLGGQRVGVAGQLHPDVAQEVGLPEKTIMAELCVEFVHEAAEQAGEIHYRPISRNPAVRRDIAVQIAKDVPYRTIRQCIERALGEIAERIWLFDVYEGKGIPEGEHSLAIALQLRKFGENLTDEEANRVRDRAVAALEELGAKQR
jgi:phenylalanyl-tRNA synthetase beta chain